MCLNCGCGQVDMRHKDTDITRDDIRRAAHGQGQSLEETTANMARGFEQVRSVGQGSPVGAGQSGPSGGRAKVR